MEKDIKNQATNLTPTMKLRWSKTTMWDGTIGSHIRLLEQLHIDNNGIHYWIEVEIES